MKTIPKTELAKILLITLGILTLTSCATVKTRIADYVLTPKNNSENLLSVVVSPNTGREDGFCFSLTNTGNETVSVNWDNSYLVINNRTYRCIHEGINFMEKAASQATTRVAPGSKISDCLFPVSNAELPNIYQGWIRKPLEADSGEYSIAVICNGKQENIQGTFSMIIKDTSVPSNVNTFFYLGALSLILSCAILLLW